MNTAASERPAAACALLLALPALLAAGSAARAGQVESPWSLSAEQRRAFLRSYAPIILKRADERDGRIGHDWITNYDFDRDDFYLPNNGQNWSRQLAGFIRDGLHPEWRIRPTLYTAIVEFTTPEGKSAVLLYHVYHAMDGSHTHDWERLEIRLDGLHEEPGSGERIRYAVLSQHHLSAGRRFPDADLNFLQTDTGRHLLIWQAAQTRRERLRKGELHFVRSQWELLARREREGGAATAELAGGSEEAFHYAFVPGADAEAVQRWRARRIDGCNAMDLASGAHGTPVSIQEVRRIRYELQDIADLFPRQWRVPGNGSWGEPAVQVLLAEALTDEDGRPVVPSGRQAFRNGALDLLFGRDDVRGYIGKEVFWGTYLFNRQKWPGVSGFLAKARKQGSARCRANRLPECGPRELWQHDYFAHDGVQAKGRAENEKGKWLEGRWYQESSGGFDGRWAQLFADHPEPDLTCTPGAGK